jgi:hypothetical protein
VLVEPEHHRSLVRRVVRHEQIAAVPDEHPRRIKEALPREDRLHRPVEPVLPLRGRHVPHVLPHHVLITGRLPVIHILRLTISTPPRGTSSFLRAVGIAAASASSRCSRKHNSKNAFSSAWPRTSRPSNSPRRNASSTSRGCGSTSSRFMRAGRRPPLQSAFGQLVDHRQEGRGLFDQPRPGQLPAPIFLRPRTQTAALVPGHRIEPALA